MTTEECLAWGQKILIAEGLEDWLLQWRPSQHSEGYTWAGQKKIELTWPEDSPWPALLLHEVTHAVIGVRGLFDPKAPHDSLFAHAYMDVVTRWMLPN